MLSPRLVCPPSGSMEHRILQSPPPSWLHPSLACIKGRQGECENVVSGGDCCILPTGPPVSCPVYTRIDDGALRYIDEHRNLGRIPILQIVGCELEIPAQLPRV